MSEKKEFGGWATTSAGERVRLSAEEAEALWNSAEAERLARERDMPTEQDAIKVMFSAYQRLKELGWREAMYCPKDGSHFDVIEAGSTGIHDCNYQGEWPKGSWWIFDGDVWPASPILFRERHEWFKADFMKWESCKKCGVVRRADDANSPCKGTIGVALRKPYPHPSPCHKGQDNGD